MKKNVLAILTLVLVSLMLCSCLSSAVMMNQIKDEVEKNADNIEAQESVPVVEPEKIYFENFAMTVEGGTYDAPVTVSFTGTEGGSVYYTFSNNLFEDGNIVGVAYNGEGVTLPTGTFDLKAVCVDSEGNRSKVISNEYTVSRPFANNDLGEVVECGYYDFVVVRDVKDSIYCYDRFTGTINEIKKFIGDIDYIVTESRVTNNREVNPELYDKIMEVASADVAANFATEFVEDSLYVFSRHNGVHDNTSYIYRGGELKVDDEEISFTYLAGRNEPRFPETMPEIIHEGEKLAVKSFVGDYYFCNTADGSAHYVYNNATGEIAEDKIIAENRFQQLAGVTSNAAYYRVIEDGYYLCKRISYEEIENMFFAK